MADYLSPRRFNRVWEMDRNGPDACGTLEDQKSVRDAFSKYTEFNNNFDRVMKTLDKAVNKSGRSFLWFSFLYEDQARGLRGRAYRIVIQLFPTPGETWSDTLWEYVVFHEVGHIVGMWLLEPQDRTEQWATQFGQWVMQGCPEGWNVYDRLDEAGALDSVIGGE